MPRAISSAAFVSLMPSGDMRRHLRRFFFFTAARSQTRVRRNERSPAQLWPARRARAFLDDFTRSRPPRAGQPWRELLPRPRLHYYHAPADGNGRARCVLLRAPARSRFSFTRARHLGEARDAKHSRVLRRAFDISAPAIGRRPHDGNRPAPFCGGSAEAAVARICVDVAKMIDGAQGTPCSATIYVSRPFRHEVLVLLTTIFKAERRA